jgi:hypothetical protein
MAPGNDPPRKIKISKKVFTDSTSLQPKKNAQGDRISPATLPGSDDDTEIKVTHPEWFWHGYYKAELVFKALVALSVILTLMAPILYFSYVHSLPLEGIWDDGWGALFMVSLLGPFMLAAHFYSYLKEKRPWLSQERKQKRLDRYVREMEMKKSNIAKLSEQRKELCRIASLIEERGGISPTKLTGDEPWLREIKEKLKRDSGIDLDLLIKQHPEGCLIEKVPENGRFKRQCNKCNLESNELICPYCGNDGFRWTVDSSSYRLKIGDGGYRMVVK